MGGKQALQLTPVKLMLLKTVIWYEYLYFRIFIVYISVSNMKW